MSKIKKKTIRPNMHHASSLLTCQRKIVETLVSIRESGRDGKNYYVI